MAGAEEIGGTGATSWLAGIWLSTGFGISCISHLYVRGDLENGSA